ncbi:TetR/AcrR family transcriptional regulator [Nocardia puris]|uniref:TetR family transcriptional regulator n=1 Tax=Nocardia puris TaxID=208602 RepID=A0A366E185_9NOCA|nr:TetR/AcrR family transcriptional regulator [Nocardia puris]MBF6209666.1 TetR/AcrR family transcriptional regulator [Nocardia puris]MBF6366238.1 TetR/AcrR family transcriptional regulator [Nocardia puris]MBF6458423.1 TetR/AcrR family transcriptional regulator [Nocardia puris]RBO96067.1 TetR family transcriptional regulator [Nocardia puris]
MEPQPARGADRDSLIERAYLEAVERVDELDELRSRLLDAAYEQFCRFGIQRSTMDDVARRAGVSRITVYRRFATKDALVEQVVLRQFRQYFDRFLVDIQRATSAADRVVLGFVSSLRAIRGNPLIDGLISAEPGYLATSLIGDGGRTVATVHQFVAGQLRAEVRAGTISGEVNVELVAELFVRLCTSFLTIPSHVIDLDDDDQLAAVAEQFLVPMLTPPPKKR